jgi:hypothetical protein
MAAMALMEELKIPKCPTTKYINKIMSLGKYRALKNKTICKG